MANKRHYMQKTVFLVTLTLIFLTVSANLTKLTTNNWIRFTKDHPISLFVFYSENHGPSMRLKEELEDGKHLLSFERSSIEIGEVDFDRYPDILPDIQKSSQLPYISFYFEDKHHILSKPGLTFSKIRHFCRSVVFKHNFRALASKADLENLPQSSRLRILHHGDKHSSLLHHLIDWSMSHGHVAAEYLTCCTDGSRVAGLPWNSLAALKGGDKEWHQFDKKWHHSSDFDSWLYMVTRPLIGRFDSNGFESVVGHGNPAVTLFVKDSYEEAEVVANCNFEKVAEEMKSKLLFSICNLETDSHCAKMMELAEVYSNETPQLAIVHCPDQDHPDFFLKYLFDDYKLSQNSLTAFLVHYLRGFIEPFVRSEQEEELSNKLVWKLVGKDISRRIKFGQKRSQDIAVLFHLGEKDALSSSAIAMVEKAANSFKGEPSIQLATYDSMKNTRAGLALTNKQFPFLRMYRKDDEGHFSDRGFRQDPNWALHFVIDLATDNVSFSEEALSEDTDL